jgi:hypothetical protein
LALLVSYTELLYNTKLLIILYKVEVNIIYTSKEYMNITVT